MRKVSHLIIAVSALVLSALCTGCDEETTQPVKDCYRILRVERQDYTLNRELVSRLESKQIVEIRPLVSGRLTKICVQEGARVKKGQPLFVIDQAPYIAAVDAAKARLATARTALSTAQLNLEGKEKLYAQQMIGEFDIRRARHAQEEAAAQLKAAEAELETARTNLGYTTNNSPVDGVIDMINYRVGDVVDHLGEKAITTINKNDDLYAYTCFSEEALSELMNDFECSTYEELFSKLPPVTFYTSWNVKLEQQGRIDAISGDVDRLIGATWGRASFSDPKEMLRTSYTGYLVIPYVMHGVIVIPQEAAVDTDNKYLVYKVVNGKAVETEVTVLHYDDGQNFVVTAGLEPGDSIIAEGAGFVEDGIEVTEKKDNKDKKGGEQS